MKPRTKNAVERDSEEWVWEVTKLLRIIMTILSNMHWVSTVFQAVIALHVILFILITFL